LYFLSDREGEVSINNEGRNMKKVALISTLAIATGLCSSVAFAGKPAPTPPPLGEYVVMATNDLGMHCVCMGFETFMLLPPFNTLRAQVIKRDINNVKG
jgi:hypothetical protein